MLMVLVDDSDTYFYPADILKAWHHLFRRH